MLFACEICTLLLSILEFVLFFFFRRFDVGIVFVSADGREGVILSIWRCIFRSFRRIFVSIFDRRFRFFLFVVGKSFYLFYVFYILLFL